MDSHEAKWAGQIDEIRAQFQGTIDRANQRIAEREAELAELVSR